MAQSHTEPHHSSSLPSSIPDLHASLHNFTQAFHQLANNIRSRIAQIEQRDKDWAETQARLLSDAQKVSSCRNIRHSARCKLTKITMISLHASTQASSLVTLNIQGQLFATSRDNLLRHEGSYFQAMLSSGIAICCSP